METVMWYLSLIAGTVCFVCGLLFLFLRRNRSQSDYIKAAAIELVAGWVLIIPYELFEEISVGNPFLHILESFLTALIRALNVFSAEGYEMIVFEGHEEFSSIFSVVRILVSIFFALFTCGWIISFFEGPAQYMKLFLRRGYETYIFSGHNDKSVAIAKSIVNAGKNKANIIILEQDESDVSKKIDLESEGLIHVAMPLRKVLRILSKKTPSVEVYLFGDREEDNLSELEDIFTWNSLKECASIRFFVELGRTPWSLYDDYVKNRLGDDAKNVVVNFVRTEENFVYNLLAERSIFADTITRKDVPHENSGCRQINILIAGMNDRNREFMKAVLHLGQMPGYFIKVTVFDQGEHLAELQNRLPSVRFNSRYCREGDAYYSLFYFENVNTGSPELEKLIESECPDFTYAFVNAGDDLTNVSMGIRIANLRKRNGTAGDFSLLVNLSGLESDKWNSERMRGISFVGAFDKVYSRSFIAMSAIEDATKAIHAVRQEEKKKSEEEKGRTHNIVSWEKYCNSEYNRHSVYARTLSFFYKMKIIEKYYGGDYSLTKTAEWEKYEHMRWNMYTRTIGYRDIDNVSRAVLDKMLAEAENPSKAEKRAVLKRFRALTGGHEDLIPYNELPPEVRNQDSLTLNENIRKILGKVTVNEEGRSV